MKQILLYDFVTMSWSIYWKCSSSSSKFYFQQNTTIKQKQKFMVNINKYIKALLHPAGGHQGSHKAHQAGNQST